MHENLAAMRKAKGLSQEELADRLGVSRQAISKWETGLTSPEMANIARLCEILETTPNRLMGYEEKPPEPEFSPYAAEEKPKRNWPKILVIILICIFGLNLLAVAGGIIFFSTVTSQRGDIASSVLDAQPPTQGELISDFNIIAGDPNGSARKLTVEFTPSFTNEDYEYSLVVIDDDGKEEIHPTELVAGSVCRAEIEVEIGSSQTRLIARANKAGTKDYQSETLAVILSVSENAVAWDTVIN